MTDLLLENENARRLVKTLGLPIPVPERLTRASGPYEERPLDGKSVLVCGVGAIQDVLAEVLAKAGASPLIVGSSDAVLGPFVGPGEAWARPPRRMELGEAPEGERVDAIVFDGTSLDTPSDLEQLHAFLGPWVRRLQRSGRVVVVGRPAKNATLPVQAATRAGLEGFTRSLAKEIGGNGSTANSVFVEEGAEDRLEPVLRFLLSPRSAYISCQPFLVTSTAKGGDVPTTHVLGGKVALVTGAARGIGEATAELLAAEGAHVVCLDRPADDGPCSKVAQRIGGSTLLVDITDVDAPERISAELQERFGGVDVVVHNAGVTRDKTLARMTAEQWETAVDINLGAVVRITDRLLADQRIRPGGRIICLSSVSGIAGNRGQTNYSAGKAGIVGFVEALAPAVAKKGITVNAIAPGFIETRLTDAMPVAIREVARRMAAVGQGGKPEDVGQAIAFLATPGASGLTGETIRVCGGALVGA
jgi:3-oxoacyl-[acyl-carrier protein] reductase